MIGDGPVRKQTQKWRETPHVKGTEQGAWVKALRRKDKKLKARTDDVMEANGVNAERKTGIQGSDTDRKARETTRLTTWRRKRLGKLDKRNPGDRSWLRSTKSVKEHVETQVWRTREEPQKQ